MRQLLPLLVAIILKGGREGGGKGGREGREGEWKEEGRGKE